MVVAVVRGGWDPRGGDLAVSLTLRLFCFFFPSLSFSAVFLVLFRILQYYISANEAMLTNSCPMDTTDEL